MGTKKDTLSIRLIASAIAGVAVSCIALPFDNVKIKMLKMKTSISCFILDAAG
jgi:hypothetical protein